MDGWMDGREGRKEGGWVGREGERKKMQSVNKWWRDVSQRLVFNPGEHRGRDKGLSSTFAVDQVCETLPLMVFNLFPCTNSWPLMSSLHRTPWPSHLLGAQHAYTSGPGKHNCIHANTHLLFFTQPPPGGLAPCGLGKETLSLQLHPGNGSQCVELTGYSPILSFPICKEKALNEGRGHLVWQEGQRGSVWTQNRMGVQGRSHDQPALGALGHCPSPPLGHHPLWVGASPQVQEQPKVQTISS